MANCVPKSGTNLLSRCLTLIPGLHFAEVYLNRPSNADELRRKLKLVYRGTFIRGHVIFSKEYLQIIQTSGFKSLLMIRDPRDVAISLLHWVTYKNKSHRLHNYFNTKFDNDQERLMAIIQGITPEEFGSERGLEDINTYISAFIPWSENGSCVIRFENLIGPLGGGDPKLQSAEIMKIIRHLEIPERTCNIESISKNAFNPKEHTFRKGQIGDWRKHFIPEHISAFKSNAGGLLINLGYETDYQW
jgi:hypothetical protein